MLDPARRHAERAAERLGAERRDRGPGADSKARQVTEHLGIRVRDARERRLASRRELGERNRRVRGQVELGRRDRITVRVELRVPQRARDPPLDVLGEVVLQHLRLVVHAVPGHPERLGQECLEQPVVAHHLERHLLPLGGELDAAVAAVTDEPRLVEPLQHRRHR